VRRIAFAVHGGFGLEKSGGGERLEPVRRSACMERPSRGLDIVFMRGDQLQSQVRTVPADHYIEEIFVLGGVVCAK
jgi:hypothetical protein